MADTLGRILVVDDIDSIRLAIREFLARDFDVYEAADGLEALKFCEEQPVDLVISDIRMPGMGGLELLRRLGSQFPAMRFALMTAYNVDEYVNFVRKEGIYNIIPKSTFLDLNFIYVLARKLISGDIFGVQHYFPAMQSESISISGVHRFHRKPEEALLPTTFYQCRVTTAEENGAITDMVGDILVRSGVPSVVRMIIEELAANAVLHAPPDRPIGEIVALRPEDAFEIGFGLNESHAIVGVTDFHGTLNRDEVLLRLERQVTLDPVTNLPVGLTDGHGRGLYITREQVDHLVFNIEPGRRTEILCMIPLDTMMRSRAISIFQTPDESQSGAA